MILRYKYIADIIMLLIVGQVVVFRYFNVYETVNKVIVILIALLIVFFGLKKHDSRISLRDNFPLIGLLLLLIINGIVFQTGGAFLSNLLMLAYPMIFMMFVTWYVRGYSVSFFKKLVSLKYIINAYLIINILVLFVQIQGNEFLSGHTNTVVNNYKDRMSGLFGYNMVAALCFFSVFVIAYNAVISYTIKSKFKRKLFSGYNVVIALVMAYISTQNDNVMYFFFMPVTLLILSLLDNKLNTLSGLGRVMVILLGVITVGAFLLMLVPNVYTILYDSVFFKFTGAIEHMYDGAAVTHGSMERVALMVYAFQYANAVFLGEGFSYSGIYTPYTHGFVHFGNSNIGSILSLGGIWVFLAIAAVYATKNAVMIGTVGKTKNNLLQVVTFVYWIFAALFSLPFSDTSISICIELIMVVFAMRQYFENKGVLYEQ